LRYLVLLSLAACFLFAGCLLPSGDDLYPDDVPTDDDDSAEAA